MQSSSHTTLGNAPAGSTATLFVAPGRRYISGVLIGALVAFGGFWLALLALARTGHLPPPAIANSVCVDEKLMFLRSHMPSDPNLMIIGSSVAWRHFDGGVAPEGVRPINAAFCGLKTSQTILVTDWMLKRLPTVRDVFYITSPHDFLQCTGFGPSFSVADADRLVFGGASPWGFYVRNFDPVSLARNATTIARQRTNEYPWDPAVFTPFGDGPWTSDIDIGLRYGDLSRTDPGCLDALRTLALGLRREGRGFMVAQSPIHPEWKRIYDPDGHALREFDAAMKQALEGTGAVYWNGDAEISLAPEAFMDAIHLRWHAVQGFSKEILNVYARSMAASAHALGTAVLQPTGIAPVHPVVYRPQGDSTPQGATPASK